MQSPSTEAVREHVKGVFLAISVLVVTVTLAVVIVGILLLGVGASGSEKSEEVSSTGPTTTAPAEDADAEADSAAALETEPDTAPTSGAPTTSSPTTTAAPATTRPPATAPAAAPQPPAPATTTAPAPPPVAATPGGALCIGDSVMLGTSPQYYNTITMCGVVDATVSRAWSSAASVVRGHAPYPERVVLHLGTNGYTNAGEIDAVLSALADVRRVVLVNVQLNGTRRWEESVNAEITAAAARWPNVRLADWKGASAGHPDYFRGDHIHPSQAGALVYAGVIAAAL